MEDYIMHPEDLNIFTYDKQYWQRETRNMVPVAGEICLVTDTGTVKIGDGIHSIEDLPEISCTYDTKPVLTERAKRIIEENIELIEQNEFNELYDKLLPDVQREVTVALLSAGIDIKTHLFPVPTVIRDILGLDKDVDSTKTRTVYCDKLSSKWNLEQQEIIDNLYKKILTTTHVPHKWFDFTEE